jgi:hypothetical protein
MHPVVRCLVLNFAAGLGFGWAALGFLVWFDAPGLGGLLAAPGGWAAGAALALSVGGTCGVLFAATGLEFLAAEDDGAGAPAEARRDRPPAPVRVAAGAPPQPRGGG